MLYSLISYYLGYPGINVHNTNKITTFNLIIRAKYIIDIKVLISIFLKWDKGGGQKMTSKDAADEFRSIRTIPKVPSMGCFGMKVWTSSAKSSKIDDIGAN